MRQMYRSRGAHGKKDTRESLTLQVFYRKIFAQGLAKVKVKIQFQYPVNFTLIDLFGQPVSRKTPCRHTAT